MSEFRKFRISGHCNGILCLGDYRPYYYDTKVILYNPKTRQFKSLPNSAILDDDSSYPISVGMGYDSRSDDYKVTRMNLMGVEYSLSTDSWRPLSNMNASDFRLGDFRFALFYKGTYYWWGSRHDQEHYSSTIILRLNIGDEVFRPVSLPVPHELELSEHSNKQLAVWKESICLIYWEHIGWVRSKIEMWMMVDGFGGESPWTRMHRMIKIGFAGVQSLVFWEENELVFETSYREIKSYNVDTEEIKDLNKVDGCPIPYSNISQAVNYVATLVSIKGGSYLPC